MKKCDAAGFDNVRNVDKNIYSADITTQPNRRGKEFEVISFY